MDLDEEGLRYVIVLCKHLTKQLSTITNVKDIFTSKPVDLIQKTLVTFCCNHLFLHHNVSGKKFVDYLWRKCHYEIITVAKQLRYKNLTGTSPASSSSSSSAASASASASVSAPSSVSSSSSALSGSVELKNFLLKSIFLYKCLIFKLAKTFGLDRRFIIDFTLLENDEKKFIEFEDYLINYEITYDDQYDESITDDLIRLIEKSPYIPQLPQTIYNETSTVYALEILHPMLISLGDLHRYYLELEYTGGCDTGVQLAIEKTYKVDRSITSKYYYHAFHLNQKFGMPHNQLGTLLLKENYNLDSIFHYLYSLICPVPFRMSTENLSMIFQRNDELEVNYDNIDENNSITLQTFMLHFTPLLEIFFYDREYEDLNELCRGIIFQLRFLLQNQLIDNQLTENIILKLIGTLFMCMVKLEKSPKIHSLNALLIGICSELIDVTLKNFDAYLKEHESDHKMFHKTYLNLFNKYDADVREYKHAMNVKNKKKYQQEQQQQQQQHANDKIKVLSMTNTVTYSITKNYSHGKSGASTLSQVSSINGNKSENSTNSLDRNVPNGVTSNNNSDTNKNNDTQNNITNNNSIVKSANLCNKLPKKVMRRRRKRYNFGSDDESDYDDVDYKTGHQDNLKDGFFDDDSDSVISESDGDITSNFSSSDDDEINTSQHHLTYYDNLANANKSSSDDKATPPAEKIATPTTMVKANENISSDENSDVIVESENVIYVNNNETPSKSFSLSDDCSYMNNCVYQFEDDDCEGAASLEFINNLEDESDDIKQRKLMPNGLIDISSLPDPEIYGISSSSVSPTTMNKCSVDVNAGEKLSYKRKYTKIDPNIIINFARNELTLKSLKILFDWLKLNSDLLVDCYASNPEFIHKMFKLFNHFNIDIFTRKVYFNTEKLIENDKLRENLRSLFDNKLMIPVQEDILLKNFPIFKSLHDKLDWEYVLREKINDDDDNVLRLLKLIDFGFSLCKLKKFGYNFSARNRNFFEIDRKSNREKGDTGGGNISNNNNGNNKCVGNKNRSNRNRTSNRRFNGGGGVGNGRYKQHYGKHDYYEDIDDEETNDDQLQTKRVPKRGYLQNRKCNNGNKLLDNVNVTDNGRNLNNNVNGNHDIDKNGKAVTGSKNCEIDVKNDKINNVKTVEEKSKIMSTLWLKHEVKALELKMKKPIDINLTPYLVVDTNSVVNHLPIIRNLMRENKFCVIVPEAVLNALDKLKKDSENARNAIRWLEREFRQGNKCLRAQRPNEVSASPSNWNIPSKLDYESLTYVNIAQFCHYFINHEKSNTKHLSTASKSDLLTLLTGENLMVNKSRTSSFSVSDLFDRINVRFEQITKFYGNYKKT